MLCKNGEAHFQPTQPHSAETQRAPRFHGASDSGWIQPPFSQASENET